MPVTIPAPAQEIIRRLATAAAGFHEPPHDRVAAETAILEHLGRLGIEPLPIEWVFPGEVYRAAVKARPGVHHPQWRPALMPLERIPWSPTRRLAEMAAGRAVGRTVWTTVWRPGWFVTYQPVSLQPSERAAQTVLNTIEMAVRVAGWRAEPLPRTAERVLDAVLPLVDGLEAGLWLFWVSLSAVMAVARPALRTEDRLLHCPDGPAV